MAAELQDAFDTGLRPSDVDPERPSPIETPWGSFAIFACAGSLHAVQSFCPHLMGPLFHGTVAGETVTCPWHRWRFSLATGERLDAESASPIPGARLSVLATSFSSRGTIVLRDDGRVRPNLP